MVMSNEKRKCIFTGKDAETKVVLSNNSHNWSKSVPCTLEYKEQLDTRPLTELEFKLVELFYEQELSRLRTENCEAQMDSIRFSMKQEEYDYVGLEEQLERFAVSEQARSPRIPTKTIVSPKVYEQILEHIESPPPETKAMKKAIKKHKEIVETEQLTEEEEDVNIDEDEDLWT